MDKIGFSSLVRAVPHQRWDTLHPLEEAKAHKLGPCLYWSIYAGGIRVLLKT